MRIRMKNDRDVSPNGTRVEHWAAGTEHDVAWASEVDLANHLIAIGDAEAIGWDDEAEEPAKARKAAPENKAKPR